MIWSVFFFVCLGSVCDSHKSAQTLIHHIVGRVHSGFEQEVEEREPQKLFWFWILEAKLDRNAYCSRDSGHIFILKEKRFPKPSEINKTLKTSGSTSLVHGVTHGPAL